MARIPLGDHHQDDPRNLAREALAEGDHETASVWAQLAIAEGAHRIAKTIGRVADVPDSRADSKVVEFRPFGVKASSPPDRGSAA